MPEFPLRFAAVCLLVLLAGCRSAPTCNTEQEYQSAVNRPRLELPGTLSASERMAPLVIPPLPASPQKLDPEPRCLDEPPSFFARKGGAAGAGVAVATSVEDVVESWAAAWSDRRVDGVMQLYSPSFLAPGTTGSAEFLDQRREQIAEGRTPDAKLDDLQVTAQSAERRTVTFVQRFDGDRVRRQLVLVLEGGQWRIVEELTLDE
jgi:hypothetical protein